MKLIAACLLLVTGCGTLAPPPADGLYAVADERDEAFAPGPGQRVVLYERKFVDETPPPKPTHLLIGASPIVPLHLASPATEFRNEEGRQRVRMELTRELGEIFEKYTADHIGGRVAVVIGGEVATYHKIRGAIAGGHLQVSS